MERMENEFHFWRGRGRLTWREESTGPTRSHSLESTFFFVWFPGKHLVDSFHRKLWA